MVAARARTTRLLELPVVRTPTRALEEQERAMEVMMDRMIRWSANERGRLGLKGVARREDCDRGCSGEASTSGLEV
jgi:hypothetical protein